MEPKLASLGYSWTIVQLLSAIQAAGAGARQSEVAQMLGITPATLSESVHGLVLRGLVVQSPGESDRRVKGLSLTPAGRDVLTKVRAIAREADARMIDGLDARRVASAIVVLEKAVANLEAVLSSRP